MRGSNTDRPCSHLFKDAAFRHHFLVGKQPRSPIIEPLNGRDPMITRVMHPGRTYYCNCGMEIRVPEEKEDK